MEAYLHRNKTWNTHNRRKRSKWLFKSHSHVRDESNGCAQWAKDDVVHDTLQGRHCNKQLAVVG